MKLEKLLTLSQFIDFMSINEEIDVEWHLSLIKSYNDFLKQPITKEMFVNQTENPIRPELGYGDDINEVACYNGMRIRWQEAEKKVIFDIRDLEALYNFGTLHELAEATSGKLTLKNVTI